VACVPADPSRGREPLDEVDLGDLVRDRVLGQRRERPQDVDHAVAGAAVHAQQVVDDREGMPTTQLPYGPVLKRPALDLDVERALDAVPVGGVGALGARMAVDPAREVGAQRFGRAQPVSLVIPVRLVDRAPGVALEGEGRTAAVPVRLPVGARAVGTGVAGQPRHATAR
jgi:hypothetical protein